MGSSMANLSGTAGRPALKRKRTIFALGTLAVMLLATQPQWAIESATSTSIRLTGLVFIAICVAGRCWCGLYIPQTRTGPLITYGPYSIVRNPYHLFSVLGAVGAGFQLGSLIYGFVAGITALVVFSSTIKREERFLSNLHGVEYEYYRRHIRRLVPSIRRWRTGRLANYSAETAAAGLLDSLHYFAVIPFAWFLESLHASGGLPVVFTLP